MRAAPSLLELQQGFADAMLGRDSNATAWVEGAGLQSAARLRIYKHAIAGTLRAALRDTYPTVMKLVGEDFFEELTERYRLEHPSTDGNLQHFGAAMAEFIEKMPSLQSLPYLADIARLEWLRQAAALAVDRPVATTSILTHWAATDPASVHLALHPSVQLLASTHAVLALWQWCQSPVGEAPEQDASGDRVLLWRNHEQVAMATVDAATFRCIDALSAGCNLESAYLTAIDLDPHFDIEVCLRDLLTHQMVVSPFS